MDRDGIDIGPEIDLAVESMVNITIIIKEEEEIIMIIIITDIEILGLEIESNGDGYRRNDRYDNRPNYRRDSYRQNYGNQGYRNRSVSRECDRSRPRYRNNSRDNSRKRYNRD